MLFRRREKPDFMTRVRVALLPSVSYSRSFQYFKQRVIRLTGSPHAIALGVAIGSGISFTPFIGFHIVFGLAIAFLLGGNLVATALGTVVGNPLTFPFIWASTYRLGRSILGAPHVRGEESMVHNLAVRSFDTIWPVVKPMIVGSVPLGLAAAAVTYVIVFNAIRAFRIVRSDRLAARRLARNGAAEETRTIETAENA